VASRLITAIFFVADLFMAAILMAVVPDPACIAASARYCGSDAANLGSFGDLLVTDIFHCRGNFEWAVEVPTRRCGALDWKRGQCID
jgi:hypothetical protein